MLAVGRFWVLVHVGVGIDGDMEEQHKIWAHQPVAALMKNSKDGAIVVKLPKHLSSSFLNFQQLQLASGAKRRDPIFWADIQSRYNSYST